MTTTIQLMWPSVSFSGATIDARHIAKRKVQEASRNSQTAWRFHRMLRSEARVTVMVGTVSPPGTMTVNITRDGVKNKPSQLKQEKYTVVEILTELSMQTDNKNMEKNKFSVSVSIKLKVLSAVGWPNIPVAGHYQKFSLAFISSLCVNY